MMKHLIPIIWLAAILLQACATRRPGTATRARIAGKVWVVTGASSGLGRGIALEAGSYGAKVVLAARNQAELEQVAAQIRASGGESLVVPTDISDAKAVAHLMENSLREWGKVDVWVNNAGVTVFGNFWETPLGEHDRVIDVNMKGTLYGSYAAIRQFQQQGYGKLINIASAERRIPTAYQSSYAATKAAIKNMGIVIRQELRLQGMKDIRLVSVDPWALNTPIWDHAANHTGHAPRMGLMDRTEKAVHAVMHAAARRRNRDMAVGWKTHTAYVVHGLLPRLSNRIATNIVYRHQIKLSPVVDDTSGNLFHPSTQGAVETDIKERMKQEKRVYRKSKRHK